MKNVVITGGARGLGRAGAERFLKSGEWRVALFDVNEELLANTARELGEKYGAENVRWFKVDVTSQASVDAAIRQVIETMGGVDALVNNAGITRDAMLHKMQETDWDMVINVNLKGAFLCTKAVAPHMKERKTGTIVNTSSVVGVYGNMGQSNYAASKFGIIGLTKTWAKEMGRDGVRVNAVAPGYTMTEMLGTVPEKILTAISEKTPLKRLGRPEDIANAYYFLANEESAFVTGQVISVDGGLVI
ncbi:MAG: 3-oxoacyl-ACP reductase FabG [Elusimicrobiales bacterium]|jgi:3-oxoacyl-[acyl-carrier protein] reductase|nr:3-oxoacyl-ACP reductase FabG [Elusimicrobiales bacterium]